MDEYLSIGQIAKLFDLNVQMLHNYDAKGLLVPAQRDDENQYRQYRYEQVYQLATIRYLRKMGYSLDKVGDFLQGRDYGSSLERLRAQSEILRKECQQLLMIDAVIQQRLAYVEKETAQIERGKIQIKTFPERYYIPIGGLDDLFADELFYFYPTFGFYKGREKTFGTYLYDKRPEEVLDAGQPREIATLPAGRYLCGYHHGPYEKGYDTITRLRLAGKDLRLNDVTINMNIIDCFVECDTENYVTEMQIQIIEG